VTPQSDLYALGAVLFELCTGRAPVVAADLPDLEQRMRADKNPVPPLATILKEIDPRFASIIDRCLAWNPADRPRSAGELLTELSALSQQTSQRRTSWRGRVVIGGAAALGIVGAAVMIYPRVLRWTRPEMALIPGGSFQMGSTPAEIEAALNWCNRQDPTPCAEGIFARERPKHLVQVSSFFLDTTEVTNRDFVRWLNTLPNLEVRETSEAGNGQEVWAVAEGVRIVNLYPTHQAPNPIDYSQRPLKVVSGFGNLPARMVTWDGALRYCREHGKRLPTEAEWEYAVRGPEGRRFPWGLEEPDCDQAALARVTGLPCSKWKSTSDEVAASPHDRTPQGIYDLGGNVSEWVMDVFSGPYVPCQGACLDPIAPEPTPAAGASRIIRGGSYRNVAAFARGASRSRRQHDEPFQDLGFRCARPAGR
jgi:formylglycine-generating enzyme required for sulfatase activity